MCKRIIQYNQALEKAEESTHEFATQFSAIRANVSVDNKFIASIPTFREQANAIRDAKQKGEVPSLKDVQTALNPESLAAKMEEGLDANARTRLKTLTAGTMSNADIMNEYISGTTGPKFGDHFNEKMKGVSDNFGVKAVWNHLIGLIMGSLYAVEQLKSTATRDSVLDVIKKR